MKTNTLHEELYREMISDKGTQYQDDIDNDMNVFPYIIEGIN